MAPTTTNTRYAGGKETTMVSPITFTAICSCCGEEVEATDAGFTATSVTIAACSRLRAAGIVSSTCRKTDGYAMAKPQPGALRHSDGLVSFGS